MAGHDRLMMPASSPLPWGIAVPAATIIRITTLTCQL
jgi:hypothetical protein